MFFLFLIIFFSNEFFFFCSLVWTYWNLSRIFICWRLRFPIRFPIRFPKLDPTQSKLLGNFPSTQMKFIIICIYFRQPNKQEHGWFRMFLRSFASAAVRTGPRTRVAKSRDLRAGGLPRVCQAAPGRVWPHHIVWNGENLSCSIFVCTEKLCAGGQGNS